MNCTPKQLISWLEEANSLPKVECSILKSQTSKWIISSVHSAPHDRNGKVKPADRGTLDLAYLTSQATNSTFVYANFPGGLDNNFHANTLLKEKMRIKDNMNSSVFWLDIHGMHAGWPEDIEFGTMDGVSDQSGMFSSWKQSFERRGFWAIENERYKGVGEEGAQTMTTFASTELKMSSIQAECSFAMLNPAMDGVERLHRLSKLVHVFAECMRTSEQKYIDRFSL